MVLMQVLSLYLQVQGNMVQKSYKFRTIFISRRGIQNADVSSSISMDAINKYNIFFLLNTCLKYTVKNVSNIIMVRKIVIAICENIAIT